MRWGPFPALLLCCAMIGCDARIGPDAGPTRIRFVHAAPDALGLLQFTLPQGPSAALPRGASSEYVEVVPRVYALQVRDEASVWSVTGELEVVKGLYQTLIAFGTDTNEAALLISDEPGTPRAGSSLVRFVHVAPMLSAPIDVHVAPDAQSLETERPLFGGLAFPANPGHLRVVAQTGRVILTTAGTRTVLLQSAPLQFVAGRVYTVIIMNADDGTPEIIRLSDGA